MALLTPDALRSYSKLFVLLDEAGQERLLAEAVDESFPTGHVIVNEGELGDAFFLVLEGSLSVRIGGTDAGCEVAQLKHGNFFGEIAALLGESRSANVVCLAPTRLLRFGGPRISALLTGYPRVREMLVKLGLRRSEDNLQLLMEEDFPGVPVETGEGPAVDSELSGSSERPAKKSG